MPVFEPAEGNYTDDINVNDRLMSIPCALMWHMATLKQQWEHFCAESMPAWSKIFTARIFRAFL